MKTRLKTKKLTMVCMTAAKVICTCWNFVRTSTPFRNVQDFDFHIDDLRKQYDNELHYQACVQTLPFFVKKREEDEETDTVTNNIKIGDMLITYSFENYLRKNSVPPCCVEPISNIVRRELIKQTVKSHKPANIVDFKEANKERKAAGRYETRTS